MYTEDFVRLGDDGHRSLTHHSGDAWNALAEFAKRFMDEYYPDDEEMHRSYERYAGEWDDRYFPPEEHRRERGRYRGQPRTSSGRFKRVRFGRERDCEMEKEEVGAALAHSHGREWMIEKAIEEASEFITAATKDDEYKMFKEFCELCVLMKGVAEFVPAEIEERACEKALEYYSRKAEMMRYSNPLLDEYSRRNYRMY